ncbi:MAG TPA: type IV pilus assembly protein PilM [Candidatus Saccharimonadales bacterium]|nr:type IV pilus assembly protein PilM [Candidatus Saccharimonadales bacterium]
MKTPKTSNFYKDKPLFGLDIGHGSLKVMQLEEQPAKPGKNYRPKIQGYGFAVFDKVAQENGIVVQPEIIAKSALDLFKTKIIGDISTRRVALAIPTYRTFTRSLSLPKLKPNELTEAVELEAEQYISLPLEELYLDYEIVKKTEEGLELFVVAVPRKIVDSYLDLARVIGLETILIEPTLNSSARMFSIDSQSDVASIIIDFGSESSDISIFDKSILVTGTVQGGGESFTESIRTKLGVTAQEAGMIKTRYGLGVSKKQAEIRATIDPILAQIIKEIRRMIRYYEERYGQDRPLGQIIVLGGGANMPGLSDYLTETLRLAVRHSDPWQYLDHKHLPLPMDADKPMFATVAGLSLAKPKEVFPS